ncbi:hypothetical protein D3C84_454090 [compost metagenome]
MSGCRFLRRELRGPGVEVVERLRRQRQLALSTLDGAGVLHWAGALQLHRTLSGGQCRGGEGATLPSAGGGFNCAGIAASGRQERLATFRRLDRFGPAGTLQGFRGAGLGVLQALRAYRVSLCLTHGGTVGLETLGDVVDQGRDVPRGCPQAGHDLFQPGEVPEHRDLLGVTGVAQGVGQLAQLVLKGLETAERFGQAFLLATGQPLGGGGRPVQQRLVFLDLREQLAEFCGLRFGVAQVEGRAEFPQSLFGFGQVVAFERDARPDQRLDNDLFAGHVLEPQFFHNVDHRIHRLLVGHVDVVDCVVLAGQLPACAE